MLSEGVPGAFGLDLLPESEPFSCEFGTLSPGGKMESCVRGSSEGGLAECLSGK